MPWIRINNFENAGYTADINSHLLPLNMISGVRNTRVSDGVVESYLGYTLLPSFPEKEVLYMVSGGFETTGWLVAAAEDELYSVTLDEIYDITPSGGMSASTFGQYSGGVLHGIAVLTNGIDAPVYWNYSGRFAPITNWVENETCKVLRPFKNFLIAGNIGDGVYEYPTKVKWSTAADPGALPSSWAEDDPTKDSGSLTLSETSGAVIDGLAVGDSFFVYKEDSIAELQYIGGVFVFSNRTAFNNFRVLGKNCAIALGNKAYVLGVDDIVVHTRSEIQSIATKVIKKRLLASVDPSYFNRSFVVYDYKYGEILFCIPRYSSVPDYAFTYNPTTGKWGERDLPPISFGCNGKFIAGDDSWNSDDGAWDDDTTAWGLLPTVAGYTFLGGNGLFGLNETYSASGSNITSLVERTSVDFGTNGNADERIKFVSAVRPNIVANSGVQLQVEIGSQMRLADPISWAPAQTFTVGTTRDLHFRVNGRYISWRVQSTGKNPWKLESIDMDIRVGAMW